MIKTDLLETEANYDENGQWSDLEGEKEILDEDAILMGMLTAANYKEDTQMHREIQIKRNGKVLFTFTVRPISDEEYKQCRSLSSKKKPHPRGKSYGMIETDYNDTMMRSYEILTATVDNGKGKIWSNHQLKDKLGVLQDIDVIDAVLLVGEKAQVCNVIEDISGFGEDEPSEIEKAKN